MQEIVGGSVSANILAGGVDEVFRRTDSAGSWGPIADGLGSVIALTDSSGAIQTSYTYEPFGKTTASGTTSGNASQYTGRENDGTGLYYYRARYYSPQLQRFISGDPIGFDGGLNLYTYAENDPIDYDDPMGLKRKKRGGPYHPPDGVSFGCTNDDPCPVIRAKVWIIRRMIKSHEGWDRKMPKPRGGDRHKKEIADLWFAYAKCEVIYESKCRNQPPVDCPKTFPERPPVPVPGPERGPRFSFPRYFPGSGRPGWCF